MDCLKKRKYGETLKNTQKLSGEKKSRAVLTTLLSGTSFANLLALL